MRVHLATSAELKVKLKMVVVCFVNKTDLWCFGVSGSPPQAPATIAWDNIKNVFGMS
jgi:hypothetical protein